MSLNVLLQIFIKVSLNHYVMTANTVHIKVSAVECLICDWKNSVVINEIIKTIVYFSGML